MDTDSNSEDSKITDSNSDRSDNNEKCDSQNNMRSIARTDEGYT